MAKDSTLSQPPATAEISGGHSPAGGVWRPSVHTRAQAAKNEEDHQQDQE
jgi:hypothetical protein